MNFHISRNFGSGADKRMSFLIDEDFSQGWLKYTEYVGYYYLLSQGALFLMDVGNGQFDTYLSLEDLKALKALGVSGQRRVRLHSSHNNAMVGDQDKINLKKLKNRFPSVVSIDEDGNPITLSSSRRLEKLRGPFLQKPHWEILAKEEIETEEQIEFAETEYKKPEELMTEDERIREMIKEGDYEDYEKDLMLSELAAGNLILADTNGNGEFEILSLQQAQVMMQGANSGDQSIRLFNPGSLGDAEGNVKVSDLNNVFDARRGSGTGEEWTPNLSDLGGSGTPIAPPGARGGDGEGRDDLPSGRDSAPMTLPGVPMTLPGAPPDLEGEGEGDRSGIPARGGLGTGTEHLEAKAGGAGAAPSIPETGTLNAAAEGAALLTAQAAQAAQAAQSAQGGEEVEEVEEGLPGGALPRYKGGGGGGGGQGGGARLKPPGEQPQGEGPDIAPRVPGAAAAPATNNSNPVANIAKVGVGAGAAGGGGALGFVVLRNLGDESELAFHLIDLIHSVIQNFPSFLA